MHKLLVFGIWDLELRQKILIIIWDLGFGIWDFGIWDFGIWILNLGNRELSREEKDPNYEVTYTLKDLNRSTPEEREQRRQRYQQHRLERQIQRENQNPVTVRLLASNSTTTSPFATVGTFGTTPRHRRRSNETPQSFSQAVSPRRSPEQVTPHFNLLNQQLAEAHLTASDSSDSSDIDTEDEMTNAVLDYLEDNLHNHTSL
ncbi:hypothetical protein Glove_74g313 [Diversispora epigaea]|uniref:Uncharacterized protein n=1 Tax=Diversispora epigaea TaxID=1348612 RepID=A0A397JK25_9GLOM|nr:hypothetical protein Glove_74g313 [Diversispora epigaea]